MKKVISLAIVASGILFAGKGVELAPVEPISITPTPVASNILSSNGVALKVGTLGVGVDVEHMFSKKHGLRLNVNGIKVSRDEEIEGIDYDLDLTLLTAGLLYDYHPWESAFRLSAGFYYNGNKIEGVARPSTSEIYEIGDKRYELTSNAKLDAKIDFKKTAPYLGIGWSSTESNGWHFTADIGVMYVGSPKVSYKLSGTTGSVKDVDTGAIVDIEDDGTLKQEIEKEKAEIVDEIKDYKWWPVIMIGIQKKF